MLQQLCRSADALDIMSPGQPLQHHGESSEEPKLLSSAPFLSLVINFCVRLCLLWHIFCLDLGCVCCDTNKTNTTFKVMWHSKYVANVFFYRTVSSGLQIWLAYCVANLPWVIVWSHVEKFFTADDSVCVKHFTKSLFLKGSSDATFPQVDMIL